jgi:hypothetical protein
VHSEDRDNAADEVGALMIVGDKTIDIQINVTHHDESFSEHVRETLEWSDDDNTASYRWCLGVHLSTMLVKIVGLDSIPDMIRCLEDVMPPTRE